MTSQELSIIIKKVLQELELNKPCPTLLLHTLNQQKAADFKDRYGAEYNILPWEEKTATPYAVLGVESLTVAEIGRIVCLAPQSPLEEEVLKALLNDKPVWVITNKQVTAVGALQNKIAANEKEIQDYGVVFLENTTPCKQVDFTSKTLITEKDLAHLPEKTKILVVNPIITPLAMDIVRMSQLIIERI